MSETKKRKFHTPEYKAKVALEALRSGKTINQIGQQFDVHPVQVGLWNKATPNASGLAYFAIRFLRRPIFHGYSFLACMTRRIWILDTSRFYSVHEYVVRMNNVFPCSAYPAWTEGKWHEWESLRALLNGLAQTMGSGRVELLNVELDFSQVKLGLVRPVNQQHAFSSSHPEDRQHVPWLRRVAS